MNEETIAWLTAGELRRHYRDGTVSPVEVVEALLARIARLDPALHAFIRVFPERARAQARAAELELRAGIDRGPLHGIPYAAKDLFDVSGYPTGAGTRLLEDRAAAADATVIRRLTEAGMILLGKTHTVQFAFGGVGINHDLGTPHNPWHPVPHAPGGSSSGSAVAVAAGLVPVALGTDTGGSVRIPAALCGLAGLKTTVGRIPRTGVYPLSETLDSVGPLARSMTDCALLLEAMQGPDPGGDPATEGTAPGPVLWGLSGGARGLRIALPEAAFWEDADPEVVAAVEAVAEALGDEGAELSRIPFHEAAEIVGGEQERHRAQVIAAEACAFNRPLLEHHYDELDPVVAERMRTGFSLAAPDYFATLRAWRRLGASARETLRDLDALLVPTTMASARPLAEIDRTPETYAVWNGRYLRNTAIGNMLGLCATTVPAGLDSRGLPIGAMFYGKPWDEGRVLRAGAAWEALSPMRARRPDLEWARA